MVWTGPIQGLGMLPTLAFPVQAFGYPALALFFAAMLGKAWRRPTGQLSNRVLTSRVLVAFGKYSYALYLLHILVRDILQNQILANRGGFPVIAGSQIPAQLVVVAFGIGVSYAVAFASWHLFEKRILALKRFFPYERQTASAASAGGRAGGIDLARRRPGHPERRRTATGHAGRVDRGRKHRTVAGAPRAAYAGVEVWNAFIMCCARLGLVAQPPHRPRQWHAFRRGFAAHISASHNGLAARRHPGRRALASCETGARGIATSAESPQSRTIHSSPPQP